MIELTFKLSTYTTFVSVNPNLRGIINNNGFHIEVSTSELLSFGFGGDADEL